MPTEKNLVRNLTRQLDCKDFKSESLQLHLEKLPSRKASISTGRKKPELPPEFSYVKHKRMESWMELRNWP